MLLFLLSYLRTIFSIKGKQPSATTKDRGFMCICVIILSNHLNWLGWTMWKLLEGLLPSSGPSVCCLKSNIRRVGVFLPFNTLLPCQQMFQSNEAAGIMWQGKSVGMSSKRRLNVCFFAKVNSCITPIYCRSVTMCQWADVWLFNDAASGISYNSIWYNNTTIIYTEPKILCEVQRVTLSVYKCLF